MRSLDIGMKWFNNLGSEKKKKNRANLLKIGA
jgi:hypothetical protein